MHMSRLLDQFREAIKASSKSRYRLWQETGIHQSVLSRFMAAKQGIGHDKLELLAEVLGMEIVLQPERSAARQSKKDRG